MPENWAKVMEQLPLTINDRNLTEQAAIGVLALLINDLEKAVLQTVLQIGSGGDYLVRLAEPSNPIQVEVSGVRDDPTREKSSERLRVKSNQVLANSRVGYVSVTAFSYSNTATVHSFLRYVKKRRKKGGKK